MVVIFKGYLVHFEDAFRIFCEFNEIFGISKRENII